MKILVTGGTGFVGSKVVISLFEQGHELFILTRSAARAKKKLPLPISFLEGDLSKGVVENLPSVDAVINLAGENIGEGRWSPEEKKRIKRSRAALSKNLISSLSLDSIEVFLQASAIGYYRDSKGDEWIDENTEMGEHFLADVCKEWEAPARSLPENIRVVIPRIGVVLGSDGALMAKLIPLYRAALGGVLGDGKQWMSWIHIEDLVKFITQSMDIPKFRGTINLTAPSPITNREFNSELSRFCQRPAPFKVPKFMLKATMGEKSYLALSSQRISSRLGSELGFDFKFNNISSALKEICGHEQLAHEEEEGFHYKLDRLMYIKKPKKEVFEFFARPGNLELVSSKSLDIELTHISDERLKEGAIFNFKAKKYGIGMTIKSKVVSFEEGESFIDVQTSGPFESWSHKHKFIGFRGGTIAVDQVRYRMPFKIFGDFAAKKGQSEVAGMFDQRINDILNYFEEKR